MNKGNWNLCRTCIYLLHECIYYSEWYGIYNTVSLEVQSSKSHNVRSEPLLFLLLFSFLPIVESGFAHRARRARAQIHRYVKRIYKSRNVCTAMYTWRTALSLKKISRDAYARLCACTTVRGEVLRAHTFVDSVSRCSTQRFSASPVSHHIFQLHFYRLVHWPTPFRNIAASRSPCTNDLSRWHFDSETIGNIAD